ncbi:KAP-like P-loop domain-containing protein [Albibacterium bauzanense]|uniref:KAP-like P-loop domain-containing protein n=2 Tax=Albibacterium bauzanense TaxID=653929 RepID=A0A4R1LQW9_9SPHI|nr:KAP-like P-loop domain-containing protein [Albibacterium bauzanense]
MDTLDNSPTPEKAATIPKKHGARPSNIRRRLKIFRAALNRERRSAYSAVILIPSMLKTRISKILITLIVFLDGRLTQFAFNPNTNRYQDLAPIDSADSKKLYSDMLLWGIKNPNVTNIAITGPYGSGKSSIIRTFQKRHPEFRTVNVSLASFDEIKDKEGEWRNKVELSVLQQLIYHERSHALPDSRFVKIRPIHWFRRLFGTLSLSILVLSYFYVVQPGYFTKFQFITNEMRSVLDLVFLVILIFGCMYLLYRLYRNIRNLRFTKLSVVSAGAEFSEGEVRSIFNKHLDEIIYFFEETRTSIVVIEDLDRFNDPEIFTKLREINILINNSRQIKHKVTFVYAVRDNIFTEDNRTKFFDFLVPVIPVINISNAGDALAARLERIIPGRQIPRDLLSTVTLYIQDMRMLLNVINEFSLYFTQLTKDLDPEKLLSLIIFKNLHPEDFAELHRGEGMIIHVLEKKKAYVNEQKEKIDHEINEFQTYIRDLESLKIKDINELRTLYIYKVMSAMPQMASLELNGKVSLSEFVEDQIFDWWRNGGSATAIQYSSYYGDYRKVNFEYSFSDAEKEVDPVYNYSHREDQIKSYCNEGINRTKAKIDSLKQQRALISGQSLKEIINDGGKFEFPSERIVSPKQQGASITGQSFRDNLIDEEELEFSTEKPTSPILIYLMANGYIDEYYHPYISYFIEGSLKKEDMNFVMSVLNRQPLPYTYEISNIDVIQKDWISVGQYSNPAILNFSLLRWLLQQPNRDHELSILIKMLKGRNELVFIDQFLELNKNQSEFIIALGLHWSEFWDHLFEEAFYEDAVLAKYAALFIRYLSIDTFVKKIDASKNFSKFLSFNSNLYEDGLLKDNQDTLGVVMNELDVSLEKISLLEKLPKTLKAAYEGNRYEINSENLKYILRKFGGYEVFPENDWITANLTTVLSSEAKNLKSYLEMKWPEYLELISSSELNVKESEETIIKLLHIETMDMEKVESFVRKQDALITDMQMVPEIYWYFLITERRLSPTWNNVSTYFFHKGVLEDTLTSYLNDPEVYEVLVEEPYVPTGNPDQENLIDLSHEVLYRNELSMNSYKGLIEQLSPKLEDVEVGKLNEEKASYLIRSNRFGFVNEIFNDLETNHPGLTNLYISKYFDDFLEKFSEFSITDQTLIGALNSAQNSDEQKANLVRLILANKTVEKDELGSTITTFLSRYALWSQLIEIANVINLLKLSFSTTERIRVLSPIVLEISIETYKNIESTWDEPYNNISMNDTTQRSFPNFPGLKSFIEGVKKLLPEKLGTIKNNKDKITIYYKAG